MKVESKRIVEHRRQRAWSQQHLAEVANLSLRTVQRIERHGQGSPESLMAIAASLGTSPDELTAKPPRRRVAAWFAFAASAALVIVMSMPQVLAEPLMLRVAISDDQPGVEASADQVVHLLAADGEPRAFKIGSFLLEFVPTIEDQEKVRIAVSIQQESVEGETESRSEAVVLTQSGRPAVIELVDSSERTLTLELTPDP